MIEGVADAGETGSDVVKAVAQVVGLLAGFVALIYAAGGGVYALRLFLEDLPSRVIVGQLPRDLLISVGLAQIVLPALGIAGLYAAIRLLLGGSAPTPRRLIDEWVTRSWRGWSHLAAASVVPAAVITTFGAYRAGLSWDLLWLVPFSLLLSSLVILVALNLRARVALAYGSRWNARRAVIWMTLVVCLASLPACLIFAATFPLLEVKVCTTDGFQSGLFIGESSERIYVGELRRRNQPRQVVSFPLSAVTETIIGGGARSQPCGSRKPN
jgi:hypothetical protein